MENIRINRISSIKIIKKALKMLLIVFSFLISSMLILVGVIWIYSPGRPDPYLDKNGKSLPGTISEKTFVKIGGVKQGMFIKGKNLSNPVLLYVHGGPAFPNYFLIDKYAPGLEDNFTVCYWEQRGGGLSFTPEVSLESMNFEQLSSDAIEVSSYLRERFKKEKIYLIAHSGGTPIAITAAQKAPHLYYAYIAMAQITNPKESEKIAYNYMLEQYQDAGNQRAMNKLKKYPVLESDSNIVPFFKSIVRDQSMHELGVGTMHRMKSIFWDIFFPVWTCKAYTPGEKINIWKSKFSFLPKTNLFNEMFASDYSEMVPKLEIPVYFFCGKYDLTVNNGLAKSYFEKLEAPLKGFYTFENSAHSPIFEEPQKVKRIIVEDVLNGTTKLSDK
jgi:pimeloyl-ACP methyl ester carboxylesterase